MVNSENQQNHICLPAGLNDNPLAKYPSVGRVSAMVFTLSLIFKYCGGI